MKRFMIGGLSILLLSAIGAPAVEAVDEQQELRLNDVEQTVLTGADLVTQGASSSSIGGLALTDAPEHDDIADSIQVDRSRSIFEFEMKPGAEAGPTATHGNRSVNFPLE